MQFITIKGGNGDLTYVPIPMVARLTVHADGSGTVHVVSGERFTVKDGQAVLERMRKTPDVEITTTAQPRSVMGAIFGGD